MSEAVQATLDIRCGCLYCDSTLARCTLFYMNGQSCLIWRLMLDGSKLSHNITEATENIYGAKGEGAVDHCTVTGGLTKFRSGCKNCDDQIRSGTPKIVDSEAVHEVMEANLACCARKVWNELVWFINFIYLFNKNDNDNNFLLPNYIVSCIQW